jgi:uncharacterized protein YecT (DUF1311 family)
MATINQYHLPKIPARYGLSSYKLYMFRTLTLILASILSPAIAGTAMLLLAPTFVAPAFAGELSFACRMTKTARAMVTCADPQLAATDIDVEAAYESTLARVDAETTSALREDQRKFLADLDRGFESSVWGEAETPRGAALRTAVAQLRRGADGDPLAALEAQMRERIAFLRSLAPPTSVTGLWKNNNAELLILHVDPDLAAQTRSAKAGVSFGDDDRGHYEVTFGMATYGFAQDHCHFTAAFRASADGLHAPSAHNADAGVGQDIAGKLVIARAGPMAVKITQALRDGGEWVCPRLPALTGPLFHTSLKADQALRLKPDGK